MISTNTTNIYSNHNGGNDNIHNEKRNTKDKLDHKQTKNKYFNESSSIHQFCSMVEQDLIFYTSSLKSANKPKGVCQNKNSVAYSTYDFDCTLNDGK
jgi:hypothetical protein